MNVQVGATRQALTKAMIERWEVPIPPLPAQRRIVAEIEKQFTRLDAGVAALRRVQANLKRYRAAVLKAACEGRLVPTEAFLSSEEGRTFESTDSRGGTPVIAISRAAARRYFPDESPVGKRIRFGNDAGPEATIVAVVADVRQRDLTTPLSTSDPDIYLPWLQRPSTSMDIAVHTQGSPADLTSVLQRTIAGVDPAISVAGVRTLEDMLRVQTATSRFASSLIARTPAR